MGPGDGYVWLEKCDYRVGLHARDEDFLDEFFNRVSKVYGEPRRHKERVILFSKKAVNAILKFGKLEDFREGSERVPIKVKRANEEVKSHYLRGFFDSQGCADPSSRRVFAVKRSSIIIREIKSLLEDIGIHPSYILEQKGSPYNSNGKYYRIYISWRDELEKYEKLVGFSIRRKQNNLRKMLDSYRFRYKQWTCKDERIMKEHYNRNTKEIARVLGRSVGSVQIKADRMGLTRDKFIKVRGLDNLDKTQEVF